MASASLSEKNVARLRYPDKVTIVTGGTKGIGEGCVRVFGGTLRLKDVEHKLVREGAKVVFCSRHVGEGKSLEEELNSTGPGEAFFVQCDLSKEDEIKNLIEKTVEKYGKIDCLINNAGWHPPHLPIDEISADDFRKLFDLNVLGYFLTSKYALPYLRKTQGNIINDSSLVERIGQVFAVTYVATKGAVSAMTRALAVDEAKYSIRVNAFSPGNVWTPLWEDGAKSAENPEAVIQAGKDAQLFGRMGTIEECGELCLFLAAEGTFLTGVDIPVSNGAELNYGNKNRTVEKPLYA